MVDLAVPADHKVKIKEKDKGDKYLDGDTNCNWSTWKDSEKVGKEGRRVKNQRTSRDHPDYSIVKIDQNSDKCPEDLRRLKWKTIC